MLVLLLMLSSDMSEEGVVNHGQSRVKESTIEGGRGERDGDVDSL